MAVSDLLLICLYGARWSICLFGNKSWEQGTNMVGQKTLNQEVRVLNQCSKLQKTAF